MWPATHGVAGAPSTAASTGGGGGAPSLGGGAVLAGGATLASDGVPASAPTATYDDAHAPTETALRSAVMLARRHLVMAEAYRAAARRPR